MTDFSQADIFTDPTLIEDPYSYFEYLRRQGAAVRLPKHDVVAVLGYDETLAVLRDDDRFSAVNAITGPFPGLPFTPEGDDITPQIDAHRAQMPFGGMIATEDPPQHTKTRSLLMGVITPRRLKDNEAFMWRLADQQIDAFLGKGAFEVAKDYGEPFAGLVIADLLGIPEDDHPELARLLSFDAGAPGTLGDTRELGANPLEAVGMKLFQYLAERRAAPRADVLTDLALAKLPDGSLPPVEEVVGTATFLFAAGRDTAVRLITAALRFVAEDPQLQRRLRAERKLIPNFLEEVLRLEGAVKANFRLAKTRARVGEIEVEPGATVMQILASANRDPKRFEAPDELRADRKNAIEHLSFGRGVHACPGAPLARAEARITLERLFDRLADIRIDEAFHGPAGARRYAFEPTYMFRGLKALHLQVTAEP